MTNRRITPFQIIPYCRVASSEQLSLGEIAVIVQEKACRFHERKSELCLAHDYATSRFRETQVRMCQQWDRKLPATVIAERLYTNG